MKAFRSLLLIILVGTAPALSLAQAKGSAVVELFTSEGCSSCPPADRLMASVLKEYAGKNVYVLAYHVDYWDRLGWRDPFGSSAWSARQNDYANQQNLSSVYTPQAIVNGTTQFTGSDSRKLHAAINTGLATNTANDISLRTIVQGSAVQVTYNITGKTTGKQLLLALVQKNTSSNVKAGENSGKVLAHVNVVRSLKTIPCNGHADGQIKLELPAGLTAQDCSLICFVQDTNGAISAAASVVRL